MNILELKNSYKYQTCYIVGRGASLLQITKEHFGDGPIIVLNEAIYNISELGLGNDIYSQWRNGDMPDNLLKYFKEGDALLLCENPVPEYVSTADQYKDYSPLYTFECQRDLNCEPRLTFSHKAAVEIAVNIFGCTKLVMIGFDSFRGDNRTVLQGDFVQSEYRPGDYHEQIVIVQRRIAELNISAEWVFPAETFKEAALIRLNIGCGSVKEQGYINIDLHDSSADLIMDTRDLEYVDNSVDEIYSSHLLEHMGKYEVLPVLKEWARVLKSGGLLKLNLPNLEWCLKNWLAQSEDKRWGLNLDMIFGLQSNPGEYHKTGFSKAHLECYLRQAGFEEIKIADHWSHNQQCFWVEAVKR